MSERPETHEHLEPAERDMAARLDAERALPEVRFRGMLARHLAAQDPGHDPRPLHLRSMVALYVIAGGALGGLGLLQALGVL